MEREQALTAYLQTAVFRGPFQSRTPGGHSIGLVRSGLQKACRRSDVDLFFRCIMEMIAFARVEKGAAIVTNLANRLRIILVEDCLPSWQTLSRMLRDIGEMTACALSVEQPWLAVCEKAYGLAAAMCALPKGRIASHMRAVYAHWSSPTVRTLFPDSAGDAPQSFGAAFLAGDRRCLVPLLQIQPLSVAWNQVRAVVSPDHAPIMHALHDISKKMARFADQQLCLVAAVLRIGLGRRAAPFPTRGVVIIFLIRNDVDRRPSRPIDRRPVGRSIYRRHAHVGGST
ncbi:hypothetical protein EBZ80_18405, partial [bacterium]|nr:hypothetical protein [bacterium]